MGMGTFVALYGLFAILSAIVAGIIAAAKRRDYSYWVAVTFLLPFMLVVLLLLPANTGPRPRRPSMEEEDDRELAAADRN
jgi:Na+-driven multidrug efflux pump